MRTIQLYKGTLELPEDWMELNEKQRRKGFELLAGVMTGTIEPFIWQLQMLLEITGYKMGRKFLRELKGYTPHKAVDIISENLIRLAECLTFAFAVEDNRIRINYEMHDCPFKLFRSKGVQPHFVRDRIISTNLTAGMYADGLQLLGMLNDPENNDDDRQYYMNQLARVLWRVETNARVPGPTSGELLAVTVWFTGVVLFFQEHDIYSVLFDINGGEKEQVEGHISLGVQEIILELTANGYPDARNMNLLEFFDAQIKMLKDRISDAKSSGTETTDLVKKTGLPLSTILRLS